MSGPDAIMKAMRNCDPAARDFLALQRIDVEALRPRRRYAWRGKRRFNWPVVCAAWIVLVLVVAMAVPVAPVPVSDAVWFGVIEEPAHAVKMLELVQ